MPWQCTLVVAVFQWCTILLRHWAQHCHEVTVCQTSANTIVIYDERQQTPSSVVCSRMKLKLCVT